MNTPKPNRTRTLLILLLVVAAPSIGALSALWLWKGAVGGAAYAACKLVLYGVPAVIAIRTVSLTDAWNGLIRGLRAGPILFGLVSGAVIGAGIHIIWYGWLGDCSDITNLMQVMNENGMDEPVRFWLFAAWLCIGNSLLEEFVFRWFIDSRLEELGVPLLLALPISALIFTLHHVIVLSAYFEAFTVFMGSAGVFLGGLIWSATLRRWSSLIPGWISHAIVDVAIILIGAHALGFTG